MEVEKLFEIIDSDFYTGVPDSQLKPLCDFLVDYYGTDPLHHIIAANEGNCAGIAAGYHLATGKVPVVYMQNSGEGNIINPYASLLNDKVYAVPVIFIIGWRGEPGVHDEPQHIYQGEMTIKLLESMGINTFIIGRETTVKELAVAMTGFKSMLSIVKDVAFVIRKNALLYNKKTVYNNENIMKREEVIRHIVKVSGKDPVVSTTGKTSRELFEIREEYSQGHKYDFLTVGSMGHSSSIAFGIAVNKPDTKVWCIDGDGAVLMHMGSMAVIGASRPGNFVHVVINNMAHETVGGMPTVAGQINLAGIAESCGYSYVVSVNNFEDLDKELKVAKNCSELCFIEVKCSLGARDDLGRPTTTTLENKNSFMNYLRKY